MNLTVAISANYHTFLKRTFCHSPTTYLPPTTVILMLCPWICVVETQHPGTLVITTNFTPNTLLLGSYPILYFTPISLLSGDKYPFLKKFNSLALLYRQSQHRHAPTPASKPAKRLLILAQVTTMQCLITYLMTTLHIQYVLI